MWFLEVWASQGAIKRKRGFESSKSPYSSGDLCWIPGLGIPHNLIARPNCSLVQIKSTRLYARHKNVSRPFGDYELESVKFLSTRDIRNNCSVETLCTVCRETEQKMISFLRCLTFHDPKMKYLQPSIRWLEDDPFNQLVCLSDDVVIRGAATCFYRSFMRRKKQPLKNYKMVFS